MINLITEHIDMWTAAQIPKSNGGRGRGKNSNGQSQHGIKKLRQLILELAVCGKLEPQDPSEEPARILLEKIAKEKARLVEEGKIKKQKPLPEIGEDEKPFDLPKGWEWSKLGEVGDTNIGLTYSPNDISEDGMPVLRANNIQNGKLDLSNLVRVNKEVTIKAKAHEGDLLICARSGSKALVGKSALITGISEEMAFGAFMAIFRSRMNHYILVFILSPLFRKMIDDVNTTTINQITQGNLKNTILPIPPLTEQHRIVAKVDELMALCDQLEHQQTDSNTAHQTLVETLLTTLANAADQSELETDWQRIANHFDTLFTTEQSIDQLKQTTFQLAVMGKLVPQDPNDEPAGVLLQRIAKERARLIKEGKIKKHKPLPAIAEDEKPFDLPESWEWARLGDVTNYGISDKAEPGSVNEDTWVLELEDVEKETSKLLQKVRFSDRQFKSSKNLFFEKDVIYGKLRPYLDKVIVADETGVCTTEMIPLRGYCNITPQYLRLVMKSHYFIRYANESTHGMNLPRMGTDKARLALFTMVSEAEQHRIVAKVDELMALCDTLKARLNDAQNTQIQLADTIVEQAMALGKTG